MGNSYESFDQPLRESMPAGYADVQASYSFSPSSPRRSEPQPQPVRETAAPQTERPRSNTEQTREIRDYLEHIGARIDAIRRDETSGVAATGHQSDYGLAR